MENTTCNYHLNAARGWIELGNCIEASKELDQIVPSLRTHPDILEIRWQIYAAGQLWTAAFEMALAICEISPERPVAWVYQAESLAQRGQVSRARDLLLRVVPKFSRAALIPYKLASYSSLLNLADEAAKWIERALNIDDFSTIARQVLRDPALEQHRELIQARLNERRFPAKPFRIGAPPSAWGMCEPNDGSIALCSGLWQADFSTARFRP